MFKKIIRIFHVVRDARTGQFTPRSFAKRRPATTILETVHVPRRRAKKRVKA